MGYTGDDGEVSHPTRTSISRSRNAGSGASRGFGVSAGAQQPRRGPRRGRQGRGPPSHKTGNSASFNEAKRINGLLTRAERAADILEVVDEYGESFNYVNVATAIHRLAKKYKAGILLRESEKRAALLESLVVEKAGEFDARSVANIVWGYAKLGRTPGKEAWEALEGAVVRVAGDLTPQAVANTLWGYGTLGRMPGEEAWHALEGAVAVVRLAGASTNNAEQLHQQLFQFHMSCQLAAPHLRLLHDDMLALAEHSWKHATNNLTISRLHKKVSVVMHTLGVEHAVEHLTEDGVFSIDIHVKPEPHNNDVGSGRRTSGATGSLGAAGLAVEVDGPTHFTGNTHEPLGPTLWRRRMLEARGYRVLSLPYFELDAARADMGEYIRARLTEAGVDVTNGV